MKTEQEHTLRTWLAGRDLGDAPPRLRMAAAGVSSLGSGSLFPAFDAARWRFLGLSPGARLAVVLAVLLPAVLAVAGAVLLRQPFPPPGLIAYTVPLASTGGTGIRLVVADGSGERAVTPPTSNVFNHTPRWSADGRTLLFARTSGLDAFGACGGVGSIVLYDVETGVEEVVATGLRPSQLVDWSPSGDRIAFISPAPGCNMDAELGIFDVASGLVTTSPLKAPEPTLNPVGTWQVQWTGASVWAVYVAMDGAPSNTGEFSALYKELGPDVAAHLEVADRGTGARIDLGVGGAPAWSPDDQAIAFLQVGERPAQYEVQQRAYLAVASVDGWQVRVLGDVVDTYFVHHDRAIGLPELHWTRDGSAIYWLDDNGGHIVEVASGRMADLPTTISGATDLQWQPTPG